MYGVSILKPIRRIYKQLQMIEDGMVIGRLTRSHQRFKFLVDVEGMSTDEREDYMRRVKESVKKKRIFNPYTGQMEVTQNPLSSEEDFFVEVTKDSKADVGVVQGALNLGNIRDVEYFQNKLFIGLGPRSLLGIEGNADTRASAIEHNINLLRRVSRLRKALRMGIKQIGNYQLQLLGIPPAEGLWEVQFAPYVNGRRDAEVDHGKT